jgi:hypothetical protein
VTELDEEGTPWARGKACGRACAEEAPDDLKALARRFPSDVGILSGGSVLADQIDLRDAQDTGEWPAFFDCINGCRPARSEDEHKWLTGVIDGAMEVYRERQPRDEPEPEPS